MGYARQNTEYSVFVPSLDEIIVSVHVVFNEVIANHTDEYFADLERLKIVVASESPHSADYQFLVVMQHIYDVDGLVYETNACDNPQGLYCGIVGWRLQRTPSQWMN